MIGFHFGDLRLALGYVAFVCLAALGVLQLAAVRARLYRWSLIAPDSHPAAATVAGFLLTGAAYGSFLRYRWDEITVPGLAGAELVVTFSGGVILTLGITLVAAGLRNGRYKTGSR